MSRMAYNKSWALGDISGILTNVTPVTQLLLTQDEENAFGVNARFFRVVGALNILWANTAVGNTGRCLWMGVVISDQDKTLAINEQGDADRRWLKREILGMWPQGTGASGTVTSIAWTHLFDYQIRGGRGVRFRKDDALYLHFGCTGLAGGESVTLSGQMIQLVGTG